MKSSLCGRFPSTHEQQLHATPPGLLRPGWNCQRLARADKVAVLIDNDDYFRAAGEAIRQARHTVMLLGWCFDPRTPLNPSEDDRPEIRLGAQLNEAVRTRASLNVYILCWDMALPLAAARAFFPQRARSWFRHPRCHFILDRAPGGACHHQKILLVDARLLLERIHRELDESQE